MRNIKIYMMFLILFTSCNFSANVKKDNDIKDKEDAESMANLFYLYTANKNYDSILNLMNKDFYKVTSKKELRMYLINKERDLGNFKEFSLKDWKTTKISGTNSKTEYFLTYNTIYSKANAYETISLIKENGKVKIYGYRVKPDDADMMLER